MSNYYANDLHTFSTDYTHNAYPALDGYVVRMFEVAVFAAEGVT